MEIKGSYNIEMCLWKHESKVVFSPRGVPYLCARCEKSKKNYTQSNRKIKLKSELIKR